MKSPERECTALKNVGRLNYIETSQSTDSVRSICQHRIFVLLQVQNQSDVASTRFSRVMNICCLFIILLIQSRLRHLHLLYREKEILRKCHEFLVCMLVLLTTLTWLIVICSKNRANRKFNFKADGILEKNFKRVLLNTKIAVTNCSSNVANYWT